MNSLKKSGWRYWEHFQAIHPGASAKGQNAFSPLRAIPDQSLDDSGLPSEDNNAAAASPHLIPAPMDIETPAQSSNKQRLSTASAEGPENNFEAGTVPPSSLVVSSTPASHPKKATKSVAGSAVGSSSYGQVLKLPSVSKSLLSASHVGATTASQKVARMSQAAAFMELKNLMAGLLDTLRIAPEDSAAKSRREMTSFVHRDEYLLPAQHMHCIMLFINNVAYTDCLR